MAQGFSEGDRKQFGHESKERFYDEVGYGRHGRGGERKVSYSVPAEDWERIFGGGKK